MRKSLAATVMACALIGLVATGCSADTETEPLPQPTELAPPPDAAPPPAEEPEAPAAPDCFNIIADSTLETLEAEGFVVIEEHQEKLTSEHRVEELFFDNGGVDCIWGVAGGGDSFVAFGYSTISADAARLAQDQLTESGYVRSESGADVTFSAKRDFLGTEDYFLFTNGAWFHASTELGLEEIREHHS